jgi:hypothetical protein
VRSRGAEGGSTRVRDLIEAGLSDPAGWRVDYGDCVCGGWSETPGRASWVSLVVCRSGYETLIVERLSGVEASDPVALSPPWDA